MLLMVWANSGRSFLFFGGVGESSCSRKDPKIKPAEVPLALVLAATTIGRLPQSQVSTRGAPRLGTPAVSKPMMRKWGQNEGAINGFDMVQNDSSSVISHSD